VKLPATLKIEAKFTTAASVPLNARELEALRGAEGRTVGIVAVLFWCGNERVDGRWVCVDAKDNFDARRGNSVSATAKDFCRLEKNQPWLDGLRQHLDSRWRPFLQAFLEQALAGHKVLVAELEPARRSGVLASRMSSEHVLDTDHQGAINAIVKALGANGAGTVFQDLLAYLIALAGYETLRINPVGVPDIELTGLSGKNGTLASSTDKAQKQRRAAAAGPERRITIRLTKEQVQRITKCCHQAGERELAEQIFSRLRP
jgi:hypothetical protein